MEDSTIKLRATRPDRRGGWGDLDRIVTIEVSEGISVIGEQVKKMLQGCP